ncbi:YeeE/YedE family protein [filamentous cyanobacterium LEGE 11480]|uniref:YeeE/YedE family protein n=1 Tax=Romeriopsis navalis LEGE 11480 TaxID=2777977 RepID=A0A928Z3R8_9CYAN|nr:YeeE/YedE family protein [Romeriopsis navalis]MBE9030287.1 YeeE/YedE family protein [Romeriopsis navalis LEGE 11480]
MAEFNWVTGLLGGVLIGLSSTLMLAFNGRITGISGILNGAARIDRTTNAARSEVWRWYFLAGMLLGGLLYEFGIATQPTPRSTFAPVAMLIGGLLVGFGTRMGNGCTSGHGVCGLGRLSVRSFVAVCTFLSTAILTVFVLRHGLLAIVK